MAATNYLLLLLLALIAASVGVAAMGRRQKDKASGPDPRRPRPPPPAPPRPRPPPPPPQPPPAPPAGPHVPTASTPAVPLADIQVCDVQQEYVLDVDPDAQDLGIPATGGRNLASSSSTLDTNPGQNLQYQRTDDPHVTDNATIKCMELKVKQQQTTEAQGMNNAPSLKESAVKHNIFDYDDVVGLMVKMSEKKTSDDSKPKFSTKSQDPTESKTAEIQDHQYAHAESCDKEVPENDSSDDGAIKDSDTDEFFHLINNGARIYMDANWKLYRSMEDLEVLGVLRENGELVQKSQNMRSLETASSTTTVQSYHSALPSSPRADINLRAVRPLSPVECFTIKRAEHIHLESVAARRNCSVMGAKRQYTRNLNSSASKYTGDSVRQGGALQRAASLPKGMEQKLSSRRSQQQTETSHTMLAATPGEQVVSSCLPSQTLGGSTCTPPPLHDAGGNSHAQSEATRTSVVTKKRYRKSRNKKLDTATQTGVQPEKWRNTGSFTTATSAGATKSLHSVNPSPRAAGNAKRTKRSRVDVKGAANQGADSISMKEGSAQCVCDAMSVPIEHTLKFGSFTFEDPIYSIIHSRATQSVVTMPKTGEQKLRGHLPQKKKKPASKTQRASNSACSPICRVCGKRNIHSGTASANMQQRKPNLQQNRVLAPVVVVPVPESMLLFRSPYVVSCSPSALNSGVGYLVNQQSAEGGSTLQNPVPGNPTVATLPGHQAVSACTGTPGNSRNQQDAAVQVNFGPLSIRRRSRPPEVHIPRFAALRQRRDRYLNGQEAGSARDASCQLARTDVRSHMSRF